MLNPQPQPLAWSAVLDEGIALYRKHWLLFVELTGLGVAGAMIVNFLPDLPTLLGGAASSPASAPGGGATLVRTLALYASQLVVVWADAAIVAATMDALLGHGPSAGRALRTMVRTFWRVTAGYLVFLVTLLVFTLVSLAALVIALLGLGIVPIVATIVWFTRPARRGRVLDRLIVLTTPFGVLINLLVRFSLWQPLIVVEGQGPLSALGRSSELVHGRWLSVAVVEALTMALVLILGATPSWIAGAILQIMGITQGPLDQSLTSRLLEAPFTYVPQAIVGAIRVIVVTLLMVHLKNLREGADLEARLALEPAA